MSSQAASAHLNLRSPDLAPMRWHKILCMGRVKRRKCRTYRRRTYHSNPVSEKHRSTAPANIRLTTLALPHGLRLVERAVLQGLNFKVVKPAIRVEANVEIRLSSTVVMGVEAHSRNMVQPPRTYAIATWVMYEHAEMMAQSRLRRLWAKHPAKPLRTTYVDLAPPVKEVLLRDTYAVNLVELPEAPFPGPAREEDALSVVILVVVDEELTVQHLGLKEAVRELTYRKMRMFTCSSHHDYHAKQITYNQVHMRVIMTN